MAGFIARSWVGSGVSSGMGARFPYGTLLIGAGACAIPGFSIAWLGKRIELHSGLRFLMPIRLVGAYRALSKDEWETPSTLRSDALLLAPIHAIGGFLSRPLKKGEYRVNPAKMQPAAAKAGLILWRLRHG